MITIARTARTIVFVVAAVAFCHGAATAEVRFGHGVFIGGHDFSHQTYNRHSRAVITLYDRPIRGAGCVWRSDRFGGRTKVCRLRRVVR